MIPASGAVASGSVGGLPLVIGGYATASVSVGLSGYSSKTGRKKQRVILIERVEDVEDLVVMAVVKRRKDEEDFLLMLMAA